jgi:hypothetical protein
LFVHLTAKNTMTPVRRGLFSYLNDSLISRSYSDHLPFILRYSSVFKRKMNGETWEKKSICVGVFVFLPETNLLYDLKR